MIILVLVITEGVLSALLVGSLVVDAMQLWKERAQRAEVEFQVRRAERQLHSMASQAFESMLDAARSRGHDHQSSA